MGEFFINFGIFIGGGACMLLILSVCRMASDSENNMIFYHRINSLQKKLKGSWKGIKILKAENAKMYDQNIMQNAHIEALEQIADNLVDGQETVEKACNKLVTEMGKEFSAKVEHIKKNNRQEINRILDEVKGDKQYIADLEIQNRNLFELLENLHTVNDKKNLKEVA